MTAWSDIQEKGYEFVDETDFNELVTNDKNIAERVAVQENLYSLSAVPLGTICMWYGTYATLVALEGWHLCDGTNGLPDLRGCFVMGAEEDADVGVAGGQASHYHVNGSAAASGSHNHSGSTVSTSYGSSNTTKGADGALVVDAITHTHWFGITLSTNTNHTHTLVDTGTTEAVPPYRKLYWIGKV